MPGWAPYAGSQTGIGPCATPSTEGGRGDANGGAMLIVSPWTWPIGACITGGIGGPGAAAPMYGTGGGPPLAELEKPDPVTRWLITSPPFGFPQSSRSKPSRMRRSICKALVGYAMTLKNEMVLANSSLSSCSSTYPLSVGSRNTAESVIRLPHWLQTNRRVSTQSFLTPRQTRGCVGTYA